MPIIKRNIESPINILIIFLFILLSFTFDHKKAVIQAVDDGLRSNSIDSQLALINPILLSLEVSLHFPAGYSIVFVPYWMRQCRSFPY